MESQSISNWKGLIRIIKFNSQLLTGLSKTKPYDCDIIHMLLELWQAWFPGEPVPATDQPLSEEPFPNVHSEVTLMLLHSISMCPVTAHHRGDCFKETAHLVLIGSTSWRDEGEVDGWSLQTVIYVAARMQSLKSKWWLKVLNVTWASFVIIWLEFLSCQSLLFW